MTAVYIADPRRQHGLAELLASRKALRQDLHDEMWKGVLHLSPSPHAHHGRCQTWAARILDQLAERHRLGEVVTNPSVREPGSGTSNYRVPDVALVPPGYAYIEGWVEDGALLVVEILSPREEMLEKLDFYAERGVGEVLYIDYAERRFEVFRREGKTFMAVSADREGFVEVRTSALRIRRIDRAGTPALEVEDARGGGPLPTF